MSGVDETKPDIAKLRVEIDRVDRALLSLIAERLELAADVRRSKSGVRVWRPAREESHVRDLAEAASGASPTLVSRIMAELMSASLAIQGPMCLHIALEGDALLNGALVRDRFGASIPTRTYPTASAALAATLADPEGVAVLPAPGGMNRWWAALCSGGAMESLHILGGLPRTGSGGWPKAVAVASADMEASSDSDRVLIGLPKSELKAAMSLLSTTRLKAETDNFALLVTDEFLSEDDADWRKAAETIEGIKRIGILPPMLKDGS